jgi:hypothetical protein
MGSEPIIPVAEPTQDAIDRKRELDIKEREVAAKEREVLAKEEELKRSRWLNPTVIGLFAAALGLIGSVVVARVNNSNTLRVATENNIATQTVELHRAQSNLVLEAIKTGNADAACKNLLFFVGLGLLDDANQTIRKQCATAPMGAPSLPSGTWMEPLYPIENGVTGIVVDSKTSKPIANAEIILTSSQGSTKTNTDLQGAFIFKDVPKTAKDLRLTVVKDGYETSNYETRRGIAVDLFVKPINR